MKFIKNLLDLIVRASALPKNDNHLFKLIGEGRGGFISTDVDRKTCEIMIDNRAMSDVDGKSVENETLNIQFDKGKLYTVNPDGSKKELVNGSIAQTGQTLKAEAQKYTKSRYALAILIVGAEIALAVFGGIMASTSLQLGARVASRSLQVQKAAKICLGIVIGIASFIGLVLVNKVIKKVCEKVASAFARKKGAEVEKALAK